MAELNVINMIAQKADTVESNKYSKTSFMDAKSFDNAFDVANKAYTKDTKSIAQVKNNKSSNVKRNDISKNDNSKASKIASSKDDSKNQTQKADDKFDTKDNKVDNSKNETASTNKNQGAKDVTSKTDDNSLAQSSKSQDVVSDDAKVENTQNSVEQTDVKSDTQTLTNETVAQKVQDIAKNILETVMPTADETDTAQNIVSTLGENDDIQKSQLQQETAQNVVNQTTDAMSSVIEDLTAPTNLSMETTSVDDILSQNAQIQSINETQANALVDKLQNDLNQLSAIQNMQDVDVANLKKEDIVNSNQASQIKVQPQSEQVRFNITDMNDDLASDLTNKAQTVQSQQTATTTEPEAPLIQATATAQLSAEKVKINDNITKISDAIEKDVMKQEAIEKLNATVTSVETVSNQGAQNGGNLTGNAQDQVVKLSIEGLSSTQNSTQSADTSKTAFAKTLDSAQTPKTLDKTDIMAQIHSKLENLNDTNSTKVTIVLKPENLGKINVELLNGKDGLTANMTAENAQVKELLDKSLDSLKSSLNSQGVNVNSVNVKVQEPEKAQSDGFSFEDKNQQNQDENQNNSSNNSSTHEDGKGQNYEFVNYAQNNNDDANQDEDMISQDKESVSEQLKQSRVRISQGLNVDYKI